MAQGSAWQGQHGSPRDAEARGAEPTERLPQAVPRETPTFPQSTCCVLQARTPLLLGNVHCLLHNG